MYLYHYDHSYLLQFPLVPVYSDYPHISSAKLRPRHRKLELELSHPESNNISSTSLSPAAAVITTLSSTRISKQSDLAVGVIQNGELHLTTVADVLQMRPTFLGGLNRDDVQDIDSDEDPDEDADEPNASTAATVSAPLQQVHMRRKESDRAEASRTQSYSFMLSQEEAEIQRKLRVDIPGSDDSNDAFMKLCFDKSVTKSEMK